MMTTGARRAVGCEAGARIAGHWRRARQSPSRTPSLARSPWHLRPRPRASTMRSRYGSHHCRTAPDPAVATAAPIASRWTPPRKWPVLVSILPAGRDRGSPSPLPRGRRWPSLDGRWSPAQSTEASSPGARARALAAACSRPRRSPFDGGVHILVAVNVSAVSQSISGRFWVSTEGQGASRIGRAAERVLRALTARLAGTSCLPCSCSV